MTQRLTFKLPKLTPTQSTYVVHLVAVYLGIFGAQLSARAVGVAKLSDLWAAVTSAAASALVIFVKQNVTIGQLEAALANVGRDGLAIPSSVRAAWYQLATGFVVMFVGSLGANLATGAAGKTTFPDLAAVVVAAISGAAFSAIQWVVLKVWKAPVAP